MHEQWDLRFSSIEYLPRAHEDEPQRFRYTTRIGLISISGEGTSVGERQRPDGARSSSLKFSSIAPLSLIREGSGYWRYIPASGGVRFLTWYDYRARFGVIGRIIDRIAFRPLMGWATAWSFDRLRLWLESGVAPVQSARQTIVHGVARGALAFVFAYHGMVPKLLGPHPDEVVMLTDGGIAADTALRMVQAAGIAEVLFAFLLLWRWRERWPLVLTLVAMVLATATVTINSPRFLSAAFNPVSLNLLVICAAVIDWVVLPGLPTASRCLRRQPSESGL